MSNVTLRWQSGGMSSPLDGYLVVGLEQAVAAPFATRQLADLGARVIKVERPDGGDFARGYDTRMNGISSYFAWLNRSKESVVLDLKSDADQEVMTALLARADVFIQNLAPGATDRLGLDAATLRERDPRLIVCDVSGYGATGPYRDKKAYDLLVQAETGLLSVTGTNDEVVKAGISVADIAGGMYAYSSTLAALLQRERTGVGAHIEVSLFDALSEWMNHPINYTMFTDDPPPRAGASHANVYPYGPFQCADGVVQLAVQNEREWVRLCDEVLERHELVDDDRFSSNERRSMNRAALTAEMERVFAGLTTVEVVDRLDRAQIANAERRDVRGLIDHPQHAARNRWHTVDSPVGPLPTLAPPTASLHERYDPVPALGEHTDAILSEFGIRQ